MVPGACLRLQAVGRKPLRCAGADQQLCRDASWQVQHSCLCRAGADTGELHGLARALLAQTPEARDSQTHHLLQSLLLGLGLPCQLGTAVTEPRNVLLQHRRSDLVC